MRAFELEEHICEKGKRKCRLRNAVHWSECCFGEGAGMQLACYALQARGLLCCGHALLPSEVRSSSHGALPQAPPLVREHSSKMTLQLLSTPTQFLRKKLLAEDTRQVQIRCAPLMHGSDQSMLETLCGSGEIS